MLNYLLKLLSSQHANKSKDYIIQIKKKLEILTNTVNIKIPMINLFTNKYMINQMINQRDKKSDKNDRSKNKKENQLIINEK